MIRTLVAVILAPAVAHAANVQLQVQGRALDAAGVPLDGTGHTILVELYSAPTGAEPPLFDETFTGLDLQDGYFTALLGTDTSNDPLPHTVFDTDPVYVEITVDGNVMAPRQRLGAVPSAVSVVGGTVDAASITVSGGLTLGTVGSCAGVADGTIGFDGSAVVVCRQGVRIPVGGRFGIEAVGSYRRWADGSHATHCDAYKNPPSGYEYAGAVGDGIYRVEPDPAGNPGATLDVYCDMTTDPGYGWQLMLAYGHPGGTTTPDNPNVTPTDPTGGYSHQYLQAAGYPSAVVVDAVRLYCHTSNHSRKIHFQTTNSQVRTDAWDGVANATVAQWKADVAVYGNHTANLPTSASAAYSGGTDPFTDFPFYTAGSFHWGINGVGTRWECDDYPNNASKTTLHQVWWR